MIGSQIVFYRRGIGWGQRDLALRLGIRSDLLSRIERNEVPIPEDLLPRLTEVLSLTCLSSNTPSTKTS